MAEKEYIEREAAIENAISQMRVSKSELCMRERLMNLPTADVRPVVLCENCQYCIIKDAFEYWCNGFCSPARLVCHDDFCSRGVKKDEPMCWL